MCKCLCGHLEGYISNVQILDSLTHLHTQMAKRVAIVYTLHKGTKDNKPLVTGDSLWGFLSQTDHACQDDF